MSLAMAQMVRSNPGSQLSTTPMGHGGEKPVFGEDAARPRRSASTRELNVGNLEALGSFTRSRTEAPSPSPTRPSARGRGSLLEFTPG
jgi:hypothetical protein